MRPRLQINSLLFVFACNSSLRQRLFNLCCKKKKERVLRITTQDNQNGEMNLFNVQQAAGGPLNPVYHPNQPIGSTVAQIYADLC